jgi:hypothetical protein
MCMCMGEWLLNFYMGLILWAYCQFNVIYWVFAYQIFLLLLYHLLLLLRWANFLISSFFCRDTPYFEKKNVLCKYCIVVLKIDHVVSKLTPFCTNKIHVGWPKIPHRWRYYNKSMWFLVSTNLQKIRV